MFRFVDASAWSDVDRTVPAGMGDSDTPGEHTARHCSECGKAFCNLASLCETRRTRTLRAGTQQRKRGRRMSAITEAVMALLAKYNAALNTSSTDAVMP